MRAQKLTKETILNLDCADRGFPDFRVGDTIEVALIVKEDSGKTERERVQLFEGDVIVIHKNGIASTFTVRRLSANNIWVEKIFPYYSPTIKTITVVKRGIVRRARLFYLRDRVGRAARIKEKIVKKQREPKAAATALKEAAAK